MNVMKAIELSLFKPSNQLDFYCHDGYFTAYGQDATLVADVLHLGVSVSDGRTEISLPLVREYTYFPKLVRAGFYIRVMQP